MTTTASSGWNSTRLATFMVARGTGCRTERWFEWHLPLTIATPTRISPYLSRPERILTGHNTEGEPAGQVIGSPHQPIWSARSMNYSSSVFGKIARRSRKVVERVRKSSRASRSLAKFRSPIGATICGNPLQRRAKKTVFVAPIYGTRKNPLLVASD